MSTLFGQGDLGQAGAAGNGSAQGDLIKDTTTQTFMQDVIEESKKQTVLVDFWAPWCGPCRQLGPVIEKAVTEARGAVKLVKMNIDEHPQIAGQMGVQSIPAVVAFKDGKPLDGFMGALPESQIKEFIVKVGGEAGGPNLDALIAEAGAAYLEKDFNRASAIYFAALQEDPQNTACLSGLVKCAIENGDLEQAHQFMAQVPEDKADDALIVAAKAALDLAEKAEEAGDTAIFLAKLDQDPNDHQTRLDLAMALQAIGDKAGAVKHLLEIIRRDRSWNEDAARVQLVQFFEAWGPTDPMTLKGRQGLSSILFS